MKNGETPHSCRISYSEGLANRSGKPLLRIFLVSLMLTLNAQLNSMIFDLPPSPILLQTNTAIISGKHLINFLNCLFSFIYFSALLCHSMKP